MIMAIDKPERGKDTTYGKSERGTSADTGATRVIQRLPTTPFSLNYDPLLFSVAPEIFCT
jgi:hypothetical protein